MINLRRKRSIALAITVSAIVAVGVGIATPTLATAGPTDSGQAINEVAPEVFTGLVKADQSGVAVASDVKITLPANSGSPVFYHGDGPRIEITLPSSSNRAAAAVGSLGQTEYRNGDGTTTVPVPKSDGTLQIATVIQDPSAPSSYTYQLGIPAGYELIIGEGGGVGIAARDESDLLGSFAAPWATDANGINVPTHYEVRGNALVQVVEHAAGTYAYPIVADPWLGQDLYYSPYLTTYNGAFRVNVTPNDWGKTWAGIATWWAHADEIKNKLAAKYPTRPASQRWNTNVQEQLYCHIAGLPFSLPEYNLEAFRQFHYWEQIVPYNCNYPEGSWSH